MEWINIILPIIVAILQLIVTVIVSLQARKILKARLIVSFCFTFLLAAILIVDYLIIKDSQIVKTVFLWTYVGTILWFLVSVLLMVYASLYRFQHYELFVKAIKDSRFSTYYTVDHKERIIDISPSLLLEINMEREEVIGKKFFVIFNKSVRFVSLNSLEIDNRKLEKNYMDYRKRAQPDSSEKEEIKLLNYLGDESIYLMNIHPVYIMGSYRGRLCLGERKGDVDSLAFENKMKSSGRDFESIQQKFIATLEITTEGLFTLDLNTNDFWASDNLVKNVNLPINTLDVLEYRKLIDPNDLTKYLEKINGLTASSPFYKTKYRVLVKGTYRWFSETGKRIFEDSKQATIIGSINQIPTNHFMNSNIVELNDLSSENELMVALNSHLREDKYFQLMMLKLTNIPDINASHSRDVSNLIMGEYIKKVKETFMTENSGLFRITGTTFAMIITDIRKMELLRTGINSNRTFLNLEVNYGALNITLEVNAGIAVSKEDGTSETELFKNANQALKISQNANYDGNGCYYSDLK